MSTKKTTKGATTKSATTKAASKTRAVSVERPVAQKNATPENLSALDAAAQILKRKGESMQCKAMIEAMAKSGLWTSPGGKTPAATLYSAILREITTKGKESRFKKVERGHFAFVGKGV